MLRLRKIIMLRKIIIIIINKMIAKKIKIKVKIKMIII